jgi:hypothetical protein
MKQNRIMQFLQYVKPMIDFRVWYEDEHRGVVELSISEPFKEDERKIGTEVIVRFSKTITVELYPEATGDMVSSECRTVNELLAWMQQHQHKQFVSEQPIWY